MADKVPRYKEVAERLRQDFASGRFPVGHMLPGEHHLMNAFGVSRHTVREALRILQDDGLVVRQAGVGTVVQAPEPRDAYVQTIQSADELLQYPSETRLRVLSTVTVFADQELATLLKCGLRTKWARISGVRGLLENDLPICWTDIYVLPKFASVADKIGLDDQPVSALIEQSFDESVRDVSIDLSATLLDREKAVALESEEGLPALTVVRRYHGSQSRVFEISVSVHPADRFTYSLNLSRGWLPAGIN